MTKGPLGRLVPGTQGLLVDQGLWNSGVPHDGLAGMTFQPTPPRGQRRHGTTSGVGGVALAHRSGPAAAAVAVVELGLVGRAALMVDPPGQSRTAVG